MIYHKFNAVRTEVEGIKFASKKEADYYKELCLRRQNGGDVVFFLRQVPFYMPNVKYVCDFVTFNTDGTVHFLDCKGFRTKTYLRKKKLVEKYFPVKIEER